MHKPAPPASTNRPEGSVSAAAHAQMRREVAVAMRTPSLLGPNIYPVLDVLLEADGLRVEVGGEAEVDVAYLPAHTCAELHALLVSPQVMPPGAKPGEGAVPVRRRRAAALADAVGTAAPPRGAGQGAPVPERSFKSLLCDALTALACDPGVLDAALVDVLMISNSAGVLTADGDGEPVLDIDTLDIPTALKLYGALLRAKKSIGSGV